MTTPDTPDRDLVAELRQRVRVVSATSFSHDYYLPLARALAELNVWLDGDALGARPSWGAEVVARTLLGFEARPGGRDLIAGYSGEDSTPDLTGLTEAAMAADAGDTQPEWCITAGEADPSRYGVTWTPTGRADFDDEIRASIVRNGGVIYRRTVTRSPWQVVDTEGGEG